MPLCSGQRNVHSLFRVYEPNLSRSHTRQNDDLLLSSLERVYSGDLDSFNFKSLRAYTAKRILNL